MTTTYSYACKDYPEMEACPGAFTAETESELWQLMEVHAVVAHGEDPASWSAADRAYIGTLIKTG